MDLNSKIFVAGHRGLVGSSIVRKLQRDGYKKIITRTREEVNLLDFSSVRNFFEKERPEYAFLAAAKVGGILANSSQKGDFIYQNLQIQNNVIHNAYLSGVKKLLFLGSSCIYPKNCPQPIKEEYLLSGYLEETNDAYAIAKIAGLVMCRSYNNQYKTNFISAMPTNLYGYNDNFNLQTSHVLPALMKKFHDAKIYDQKAVTVWGTGAPLREFLFVEDLAEALVFLMNNYNEDTHINVGTGRDISIKDLAYLIKDIVGFKGEVVFDPTKPDGTPRKLLDVSKLEKAGWKAQTSLEDGIKATYQWFLDNQK
ncbi:MAG TPA: GDP-L-fucose synthase [Spirochaetota bacterium]|jgi:GDP-L-fucose synthase|nr:MAG: GDP-L-fucose synthase [Spirochaetes bacterium ADurb.Bin133]HNZ26646.1 GDP-L-fucose synthase [Spirochaetota bacterium]HOF00323.1 GDP-L-fucose synthase [Spirochaetota bacterium]HOS32434.1 GDP-L-fucose synthase [Spirochaetota bacterium]HOS55823.1 GDP-L-fucose synthase [Spirochaetota bacterium]